MLADLGNRFFGVDIGADAEGEIGFFVQGGQFVFYFCLMTGKFQFFFVIAVFCDVFVIKVAQTGGKARVVRVPVVITQVHHFIAVMAQVFFYAVIQPVKIRHGKDDGLAHKAFWCSAARANLPVP